MYGQLFSAELQKQAFLVPAAAATVIGTSGGIVGAQDGADFGTGAKRALGGALLGVAPGFLPAVVGSHAMATGRGGPKSVLTAGLGLASNIGGIGGAIYGAGKTDKPWWYYPMRGATLGIYS